MRLKKKWGMIVISSIIFFISIGFIQTDAFSNILSADTSNNVQDIVPGGRKVELIHSTEFTLLGLEENGNVFGFGDTYRGVLTLPNKTENVFYPTEFSINDTIVDITGETHAVFFLSDQNDVYALGTNTNGMFGDPAYSIDAKVPTPTKLHYDIQPKIVSAANRGMLIQDILGNVYGAGYSSSSMFMNDSKEDVDKLTKIGDGENPGDMFYGITDLRQQFSLGRYFLKEGKLYFWGVNHSAGRGSTDVKYQKSTLPVLKTDKSELNDVVMYEGLAGGGGNSFVFALDSKNQLWGWGTNVYGTLGLGHKNSQAYATLIKDMNEYNSTIKDADHSEYNIAFVLENGNVLVGGSNDAQSSFPLETEELLDFKFLETGNQNASSGLLSNVKKIELGYYTTYALTEQGQIFVSGTGSSGTLGLNKITKTKDFTKVIFPIKPILSDAKRLDADNKEIIDDPSTVKDESIYQNYTDNKDAIVTWDKYNSSIKFNVKRESMSIDDDGNEKAIDYGDLSYEYCDLEYVLDKDGNYTYDASGNKKTQCQKDAVGKEIWSKTELISERDGISDDEDTVLVDGLQKVKEHEQLIDLNSKGSPEKVFRKYRYFYDEVRERYDVDGSEFDPYSYVIVDLDRGDPEVRYLNLTADAKADEIVDKDGTYDKILKQQVLYDEQYFGHGIRIYLPEGTKAYVVLEKTKNGKKYDETINGFGDAVGPRFIEGKQSVSGIPFNDFFPKNVANGKYRIYYVDEYGNDVELHFRISHDKDRPLILPNDNDSGGGDWKEELFNDDGDKIGEKQHYGGVYIVDMDTADPTKWDSITKTPVKNYQDANGDMIYAIEGAQGTYTSDATPDRPKTIENNEVIKHQWMNHSLWLTVTGQDEMKTTSTLDALRIYKLDEEGNRIQPADSVVNFDEGVVSQIKNNYAIPVKENGNYELVLQDFAGNENVSQGNEARGVFFTVNFIDTKAPVIKEPLKVRDPDTNELNITLDADDGNGSGVVKDDPSNNNYGIYYQFVADGKDPDDTKWLSYVQDEDDPDHILHVPNKNFIGKLYVKAYDNAGNIKGEYDASNQYANMVAFDIADDSDAPAITYLGGNPASWQNTDVVVSFKASDNIAIEKVELVSLTDGTIIDTLEPKYENKVYSECKSENHNCAINGNDISFSYTISKNDTYQVIAYDMAGNKTTAIIDSNKPDPDDQTLDVKYIDKDQPTVELSRTKKGELKLIALDVLSGIKTSGTPSNLVYDGMEYLILKDSEISNWNDTSITTRTDWKVYDPSKLPDVNTFDCYVYVRITDQAGNVLIKRSDLFTVSDLQPPVYVSSREATSSTYRRGVNQAVKVSVNFKDNIGLKEVEVRVDPNSVQGGVLTDVNGTTITEYKKSDYKNTKDDWFDFYVKQNGDYQVRATDENGNVSDWTDLEVSMIDQIEPTMTVSVNNGKFKVENVNGTISDIAKVYNDKGSLVDDISYQFVKTGDSIEDSNDTFISVGEEVSIPKGFTGTLYIKTYDEAKLQFDPLSKGNVKIIKKAFEKAEPSDTEPPVLVSTTGNPTDWTNQDVNLTLQITDNESGLVRVSVKDQMSGMVIFHKNDFAKATRKASVSGVMIKSNGAYVVEMEDADGNISDNALKANIIEVTRIDKRKPVIEHISWVNAGNILFPSNDVKADISSYDEPKEDNSSIVKFKYAFVKKGETAPDPKEWEEVPIEAVDELIKTNKDFVGKLVMRAIDAAGNESETMTASVGESTGKDTKPSIEIVQGDQEPWLKAGEEMELIVKVKEPSYGITHIEVMDHASGLSTTYAPYDHDEPDYEWHEYRFKVTENGMYTIKAINANGDRATLPIYVSHFDTTTPILSSIEWIKGSARATIHASDPLPGSGLKTLYYQLVAQGATMSESAWMSADASEPMIAIDENYKGSIYAKACDAVGNCSDINIQSLYLDQGTNETDKPLVEILEVNDEAGQEEGTAKIKVSDQTSGVHYFIIDGPGVVGEHKVMVPEEDKLSSEHTIAFHQLGTYTIIAYDYAGNASEPAVFTVEHIKKPVQCEIGTLPELNVDSDGNGIPDLNLDPFDTGKPSINIDLDCDNIPDVNIDNNGDGYPDLNIDHNDGIPYKNLVTITVWKPNQDFTLGNGYHYETMTNLIPTDDMNGQDGNGANQNTANSGGAGTSGTQDAYTNGNAGAGFIAPVLGTMNRYWWWYLLLLILASMTMRWCKDKLQMLYEQHKLKQYENDIDDL